MMGWAWENTRQLLRPLAFLRLEGPTYKRWYDYGLPLVLAVLITAFLIAADSPIARGSESLLAQYRGLLAVLVALYLGGLGVFVALPGGGDLDQTPDGEKLRRREGEVLIALTRREVIMSVLNYLSFVALMLFGLCMFGTLGTALVDGLPIVARNVLRFGTAFVASFALAQIMVVTTFLFVVAFPSKGRGKAESQR